VASRPDHPARRGRRKPDLPDRPPPDRPAPDRDRLDPGHQDRPDLSHLGPDRLDPGRR
jgi:hypothetical protein